MFKKNFLILILILLLTNCSAPGTALLGPAFTGVTTKSAAQASLSFGTNQVVRKIHETAKKSRKQVKKIVNRIDNFDLDSKHKHFFHFYR